MHIYRQSAQFDVHLHPPCTLSEIPSYYCIYTAPPQSIYIINSFGYTACMALYRGHLSAMSALMKHLKVHVAIFALLLSIHRYIYMSALLLFYTDSEAHLFP